MKGSYRLQIKNEKKVANPMRFAIYHLAKYPQKRLDKQCLLSLKIRNNVS